MDKIDPVLDRVIKENEAIVGQWLADKPGSWGALAGKAVVAVGRQLGRSLKNEEKHAVWQMLWDKLMEMKENA